MAQLSGPKKNLVLIIEVSAYHFLSLLRPFSPRTVWLLKVNDLQLEEFYEDSVPPNAILSHTWGLSLYSGPENLCVEGKTGR